ADGHSHESFIGNGGSGGGVSIHVTTMLGSGRIRAAGGDAGGAYGGVTGGSGGGGRIAISADNASDLDTTRFSAPAGKSYAPPYDGGAGTVYLSVPGQSTAIMIIDSGSGGAGKTPLGLPGETSPALPDDVVIRGAGAHVQPEHSGMTLEFPGSL